MYLQKGDSVDICCGEGINNGVVLGSRQVVEATPGKITLSDNTEWRNKEYGKGWKVTALWCNYILKTREKAHGLRARMDL